MTFYTDKIKTIHLEVTDFCNAACPQCARNKLGGAENQYLPKSELSLTDIKKIIPSSIVANLHHLFMCGNYGDPIVAKDTLEIFSYLRDINPTMKLSMNTNGSARDTNWWKRLAEVYGEYGAVKFGIDGLGDSHHLYRRKTNFDKIIQNAKAFIEAGGKAHWEFLVFKHNEHQVDEARALSESLGFKNFTVKKTGRFFSNTKVKTNDFQQVLREDGELDYIIEKPTLEKFQNKSLKKEMDIISQFGSMENYLDQTPINCKVIKESSLYISSEGLVFPCCWTANQLYLWYMPEKSGQIWNLINKLAGKDSLDGKKHHIEDIITGSFYNSIKEMWSCNSVKEGKPKVCAKTCGTLFDQFRDQYK